MACIHTNLKTYLLHFVALKYDCSKPQITILSYNKWEYILKSPLLHPATLYVIMHVTLGKISYDCWVILNSFWECYMELVIGTF